MLSKGDRDALREKLTQRAVNLAWVNVENTLALLDTCDALSDLLREGVLIRRERVKKRRGFEDTWSAECAWEDKACEALGGIDGE